MSSIDGARIEQLCDDWCSASELPGGGMSTGAHTERFRLVNNGVQFHALDFDALTSAVVGLSRVLLRPNLNTVIVADHFLLWSWCAELLLSPQARVFPMAQNSQLHMLYSSAVHASLAHCRKMPKSREEWDLQNKIIAQQPHHAQALVEQSGLILAYLSFPLLEAVTTRACAAYLSPAGEVLMAFEVIDKKGQTRPYKPQKKCSSVRDILFLLESRVANHHMKKLLARFSDHLSKLDPSKAPFDLLYDWRNQLLHGTSNLQTIGGCVLNLCFLISLFEIETDFEARRESGCRNLTAAKSPWNFYPPF